MYNSTDRIVCCSRCLYHDLFTAACCYVVSLIHQLTMLQGRICDLWKQGCKIDEIRVTINLYLILGGCMWCFGLRETYQGFIGLIHSRMSGWWASLLLFYEVVKLIGLHCSS